MKARPKILFVSENVTLAQVVRLAVLAKALDPNDYEVHFAASNFDPMVFDGTAFARHELFTIGKDRLFKSLKAGKRLYEKTTLVRYVKEELALIESVRPDLIVGDFRLSLSISAELQRVPWGTLINAYFSPFAVRERWPVPDHPIVKVLGEEMTARYFPMAIPKVFAHFASPINAVRRKYGLGEIGSLLEVLTHADHTLYPDDPVLTPVDGAPPHHEYLGPVLWAPTVSMPALAQQESPEPLVYVTLGSSGNVDLLPVVVEALSGLKLRVVIATAGRNRLARLPPNMEQADFVPGDRVAQRARIVISNGGSTTGYQALAAGTPLLGLPSNLDQYLTMQALTEAGVAVQVRGREADVERLRLGIHELLNNPGYSLQAREAAKRFAEFDSAGRFRHWVERALGKSGGHAAAE